MNYGLIGEKLSHSFSAGIHALLGCEYELKEIAQGDLADFLTKREFAGINVTIPYKQAVIPFLDEIDPHAAAIGAVNTIVNRNGKLCGYNTDYFGLKALIEKNGVSLGGKTVLILGTGGTSLTAAKAAKDLGAAAVVRVSRSAKDGAVDYDTAYRDFAHCECIINTTPVGMYPQVNAAPIKLSRFDALEAVFDAVYNPLRTHLVLQAKQRSIAAEGGLYMLVAQAVFASELFLNKRYPAGTLDAVFGKIKSEKQNIVLTGMPGSGKSTVGKLLSEALGKPFYDTDALIVAKAGMEISDIFAGQGEAEFRKMEHDVIADLAREVRGAVIATGGGAVLDEENVIALQSTGKVYFLNRKVEDIVPTADRPLALDRKALENRFRERYETYMGSADKEIIVNSHAQTIAQNIRKDFLSEN